MRMLRTMTLVKVVVALLWAAVFIGTFIWLQHAHILLRHMPRVLVGVVRSYGFWGPLLILVIHILRTFLLLPTTALTIISGTLYGPLWGTMLTITGENLSATFGFLAGRFFGRRYVKEHEHGWIRRYDDLLSKEGFFTIVAMRLLFFPFDVVNYLSGMTGITFRQYFFATVLGTIPGIITFTVLGGAFDHPLSFIFFGVMCLVTIVIILVLRRSKWAKEKLFAKRPEHVI